LSTERQSKIELHTLLSRLSDNGVSVEEFKLSRGTGKLYMLGWKIDPFPFCERQYAWYPLIVKEGQIDIDRDTADAVLRHVWHSILPFFDDELEDELKPTTPHEQEIADKVEAKARAVRDDGAKWGDAPFEDMRASMTFDLSDSECDYLELRIHWRQEIPRTN